MAFHYLLKSVYVPGSANMTGLHFVVFIVIFSLWCLGSNISSIMKHFLHHLLPFCGIHYPHSSNTLLPSYICRPSSSSFFSEVFLDSTCSNAATSQSVLLAILPFSKPQAMQTSILLPTYYFNTFSSYYNASKDRVYILLVFVLPQITYFI